MTNRLGRLFGVDGRENVYSRYLCDNTGGEYGEELKCYIQNHKDLPLVQECGYSKAVQDRDGRDENVHLIIP